MPRDRGRCKRGWSARRVAEVWRRQRLTSLRRAPAGQSGAVAVCDASCGGPLGHRMAWSRSRGGSGGGCWEGGEGLRRGYLYSFGSPVPVFPVQGAAASRVSPRGGVPGRCRVVPRCNCLVRNAGQPRPFSSRSQPFPCAVLGLSADGTGLEGTPGELSGSHSKRTRERSVDVVVIISGVW